MTGAELVERRAGAKSERENERGPKKKTEGEKQRGWSWRGRMKGGQIGGGGVGGGQDGRVDAERVVS
jgi:hypothetical protein